VYLSLKIGNAAYQSETLYEELRRSIPQLANLLLSAEEDKTKANAAILYVTLCMQVSIFSGCMDKTIIIPHLSQGFISLPLIA
jgi:hypothetical protein